MKMDHIIKDKVKNYDIYHDGIELILVIHEKDGDISYHGSAMMITNELVKRGLWK